ncbi:MAG: LAGLIDADG family homing endonuclease [Candidatus Gottesmanbacteria bacterium]
MLEPWMVTGFTDGEGCFALYVRKDTQKRTGYSSVYYRWQVDFCYNLRGDDMSILQEIRDYFACGVCSLSHAKNEKHNYGQAQFHCVVAGDLIEKVIPHFERYPLQSKKKSDFNLWKRAVEIVHTVKERKKDKIGQKVEYLPDEQQELINICNSLKNRVTGDMLKMKRINYNSQGTKEREDLLP